MTFPDEALLFEVVDSSHTALSVGTVVEFYGYWEDVQQRWWEPPVYPIRARAAFPEEVDLRPEWFAGEIVIEEARYISWVFPKRAIKPLTEAARVIWLGMDSL